MEKWNGDERGKSRSCRVGMEMIMRFLFFNANIMRTFNTGLGAKHFAQD